MGITEKLMNFKSLQKIAKITNFTNYTQDETFIKISAKFTKLANCQILEITENTNLALSEIFSSKMGIVKFILETTQF